MGGKQSEGASLYWTSHFFPFMQIPASEMIPKHVPSHYLLHLSLSLSHSFHCTLISSESLSTEVRSASYLDFYSSHNKQTTVKLAVNTQTGLPQGLTGERSETTSSLLLHRELFTTALIPPIFYSKPPCPPMPAVQCIPLAEARTTLCVEEVVGYASHCRLLCTLCSQGCLLCGPQASGL